MHIDLNISIDDHMYAKFDILVELPFVFANIITYLIVFIILPHMLCWLSWLKYFDVDVVYDITKSMV